MLGSRGRGGQELPAALGGLWDPSEGQAHRTPTPTRGPSCRAATARAASARLVSIHPSPSLQRFSWEEEKS